jgi:hypothetical protein
MGLGAGTIELYRQLKLAGALDGITEVMELGSQDYWCPQVNLMNAYFRAFGREIADPAVLHATPANQKPARLIYEGVGIKYNCVDVDGRAGTIAMDLNLDVAPAEHKGKYGLVTNHGTSEHLINQVNLFKVMHDFARTNGVLVHAVPFMGYVDHGFFSYHPNFFDALARYNSYEMIGMWIGLSSHLPSYIPWSVDVLECLSMSPKSTLLIIAVMRKIYDREFCVPFQGLYEDMMPADTLARYQMIIDAEVMDGKRVRHLSKKGLIGEAWDVSAGAIEARSALSYRSRILSGERSGRPAVRESAALREVAGRDLVAELGFRLRRRLAMVLPTTKRGS